MNEINLLHVDADLLVVEKPAGLLSVPGRGPGGIDNIVTRVQQLYLDALTVHRLDQATSGLMLLARGAAMQRALSMAFEARVVRKQYVAVVHGVMAAEQGVIDAALAADWPQRPRQKIDAVQGKAALTRWWMMQRGDNRCLLRLEPVTGRSHQLRVHLQSIGHAIVGDRLYATPPVFIDRLLLHASELAFNHPINGRPLQFSSALPFGLDYSATTLLKD